MKEIEKTSLEPCDLVVFLGEVYRVEAIIPGRRCATQCHLYDEAARRCPGICYRYDNSDDIAFRHLMPVGELSKQAEVCITPTWREWAATVKKMEREANTRRTAEWRKRKECGDINPQHVAELRKDAAVAYNFITDQMEMRTRP